MPRQPRFSYPRAVHHVTLRCNNREFLFDNHALELFLRLLHDARGRFPIRLYSYCLMTNHIHLLIKVGHRDTLSQFMHWLASSFSRRHNRASGRTGRLWEARFRSTIIEQESFLLRGMAYLDLNPLRAGIARSVQEYAWSSYQAIRAEKDNLIDLHPAYLACGRDPGERRRAYVTILARERERTPFTLATEHFAGTPAFVRRMTKKFDLAGNKASVRLTDLGDGIVTLGPRLGDAMTSLFTPTT